MQLTRKLLDEAVAKEVVTARQADALWAFLADATVDTPTFKPAHILYYLGGLTAIGAMTLFMTLGWERYRGWGLVAIATVYAVVALALTAALLKRQLALPAGIAAVLAVVMVPLAVYGAQHALGFWAAASPPACSGRLPRNPTSPRATPQARSKAHPRRLHRRRLRLLVQQPPRLRAAAGWARSPASPPAWAWPHSRRISASAKPLPTR